MEKDKQTNFKEFFPPKGYICPYCDTRYLVGEWNPKVPYVCEDCTLLRNAGSIV